MADYGTAWRILRPVSLTDQIYIKANRIRSIEETGVNKVGEGIEPEFIGIINYSIMGLIQLETRPQLIFSDYSSNSSSGVDTDIQNDWRYPG